MQLDPNTVAVLLNAVYFKASWAQPFDAKRTKPGARLRTPAHAHICT